MIISAFQWERQLLSLWEMGCVFLCLTLKKEISIDFQKKKNINVTFW